MSIIEPITNSNTMTILTVNIRKITIKIVKYEYDKLLLSLV